MGESVLQTLINESSREFTQVIEKSLFKPKGAPMPAVGEKVSYGRVVRIPTQKEGAYIGDYAYRDVTVADAKREAKRLNKLAKQIRKACQ
jgi:hypothetical protein